MFEKVKLEKLQNENKFLRKENENSKKIINELLNSEDRKVYYDLARREYIEKLNVLIMENDNLKFRVDQLNILLESAKKNKSNDTSENKLRELKLQNTELKDELRRLRANSKELEKNYENKIFNLEQDYINVTLENQKLEDKIDELEDKIDYYINEFNSDKEINDTDKQNIIDLYFEFEKELTEKIITVFEISDPENKKRIKHETTNFLFYIFDYYSFEFRKNFQYALQKLSGLISIDLETNRLESYAAVTNGTKAPRCYAFPGIGKIDNEKTAMYLFSDYIHLSMYNPKINDIFTDPWLILPIDLVAIDLTPRHIECINYAIELSNHILSIIQRSYINIYKH